MQRFVVLLFNNAHLCDELRARTRTHCAPIVCTDRRRRSQKLFTWGLGNHGLWKRLDQANAPNPKFERTLSKLFARHGCSTFRSSVSAFRSYMNPLARSFCIAFLS